MRFIDNVRLVALTTLIAAACGGPAPERKTISSADTAAAFGSNLRADTTGLGNRPRFTQAQLDSQNAAIRASERGAALPPPKRVVRRPQ